ncbi:MAG: hypothetical protein JSR82_15340 [Verrucomicrobia bacterium]|nr:hypothetical protein [Verrucomicrobiota bacterium]
MLPFPKWLAAYDAIADGEAVAVLKHDGKKCTLEDADGDEGVNRVFGDMIVALMLELRDDGTFKKLPLAPKAFMVIEEFDGRYGWPKHPEKCYVS